jgi:propanol-preferring alcohol dehydrogenase
MQAWRAAGTRGAVEQAVVPQPVPGEDEILVRVEACGVCRTDLHVVDRDLPVHRPGVIPGHQVVGTVFGRGSSAHRFEIGDRVGIAWLRETCGACRFCRSGRENLCLRARFTGWDEDGGFAEFARVGEAFAYRLPRDADPFSTAPLLCAGIIGYRALQRANLPVGGRLAIFGFGSSAGISARLARAAGAEVVVVTRGDRNRRLAADLGFAVTAAEDVLPDREVDSAIVFAPAGGVVPLALRSTAPGGTVVVAGIHLSTIPELDYDALLFRERDLRSVTANTRADGDAFLSVAHRLRLEPTVTRYRFEQLPDALDDLRSGRAGGSLVLEAPQP